MLREPELYCYCVYYSSTLRVFRFLFLFLDFFFCLFPNNAALPQRGSRVQEVGSLKSFIFISLTERFLRSTRHISTYFLFRKLTKVGFLFVRLD